MDFILTDEPTNINRLILGSSSIAFISLSSGGTNRIQSDPIDTVGEVLLLNPITNFLSSGEYLDSYVSSIRNNTRGYSIEGMQLTRQVRDAGSNPANSTGVG